MKAAQQKHGKKISKINYYIIVGDRFHLFIHSGRGGYHYHPEPPNRAHSLTNGSQSL